ncbi:zinc finger protein 385C isoform X2 [Phycodurus eques]|uniref:zinc finger protein 385C isoform X2 n=1 Tax=Phycodurus eques TaxID=693459 RepID=UPI002ACD53EA|nr:zinc finger protein 385C isoform X2 [Phycodurus eques]
MKRPCNQSALSSSEADRSDLPTDGGDCGQAAVADRRPPLGGAHRPKRERKQRSYTMCDICNIQLNSAAQAQIHYNGKSHQKRLKKNCHAGKAANSKGTSGQGGPLLASLPVARQPLQPQLDLKHLLPFRLNGSSPLSLFPNFNTNQAEAHYKGHKHARKLKAIEAQKNRQRRAGQASSGGRVRDRERDKTKTSEVVAPPSVVDSSSEEATRLQSDLEASALDVKMAESPRSSVMLTPVSDVSASELAALSPPQISLSSRLSETASDSGNPEASDVAEVVEVGDLGGRADKSDAGVEVQADEDGKKSKAHLHCPVCKVTMNSTSQLEAHNSGTKHKLMLEGQSVLPRRRGKMAAARANCKSKRLASKGSLGVSSKSFQCELCEIFVNSEMQLSQHMNSRRHKDRVAGKPPKPKFTPHSKSQQTSLARMRWSGCAGAAVSAMKKALGQYRLTSISSQTKLALQKQLTKSFTAGFLPGPLTPPTLCTVAANPLALRHPLGAASAAFMQTPFLGPAFFRPAPGPLRAAHTPIIFSPY